MHSTGSISDNEANVQLAPTNCTHAGIGWGGPPGLDPPASCDGG